MRVRRCHSGEVWLTRQELKMRFQAKEKAAENRETEAAERRVMSEMQGGVRGLQLEAVMLMTNH